MPNACTCIGGTPPLLLTAIWSLLPTSTHHAYACSAGSMGYHALKEMLQNGKTGNTLLLESSDLWGDAVPRTPLKSSCSCRGGVCASTYENLKRDGVGTATTTSAPPPPPVSSCCLIYTFPSTPPGSPASNLRFHYRNHIPESVTHITIYSNRRILPRQLLMLCRSLQTVSLHPLSSLLSSAGGGVTEIGDSFLSECSGLKEVDLGALSNVSKVDGSFLTGCSGLITVDLRPLSKLVETPEYLLSSCKGLSTIRLSPLSNVKVIGRGFMSCCSGLTPTIDLSPLSNVVEIKGSFLAYCTGLESLNVYPLSKVKSIGGDFLLGCTGLKVLDCRGLKAIEKFHAPFLLGCKGLKDVWAPPNCPAPLNWAEKVVMVPNKKNDTRTRTILWRIELSDDDSSCCGM